MNYGLRFYPRRESFDLPDCWAVKGGMALMWPLLMTYVYSLCCVRCIETVRLCFVRFVVTHPQISTKTNRLENKPTLFSPTHFLNFTLTLPALTRCAQDTLLAAESIASVGQMRSRLLPISLAGNQECPPSPPPHPLLPPPPPSSPNGSYQTHQEICDRTILRPWEDCHQLPQRWRIMSTNALHLCTFFFICACQSAIST